MAVAVAKGTLVADVVAADTVAGVAPCIMGTWRERSHRQLNQSRFQAVLVLTLHLYVCLWNANKHERHLTMGLNR